jgi:hypothetical protein
MRRVLVLVLLLALSGCTGTREPDPVGPTPTPPATPTATPTASAVPHTDRLTGLPTGPPPRVAYVRDAVIVHPNGRRERLVGQRRIGVTAFTRFRDGYLVADQRIFEGTVGLAYVEGPERTDLGPCSSGGGVLNRDGNRVAWLTQLCPESGMDPVPTIVHVASAAGAGEEQREIDREGIVRVNGFVGEEVVVSGFAGGVQLVGPRGRIRTVPLLDTAISVNDARGLVAGVLPDGGEYGAVVEVGSGAVLWSQRHVRPVAFSPDGTLLAAYVRRRPALVDAATGHVVALVLAPGVTYGWTWEDDRHVLAVIALAHRQAMVRIDLRGHVTRVGPLVPDTGFEFVFETRA